MAREVPVGARAEITRTVEHQHTLTAVSSEMPPVLSTPWMIGWMETAYYFAQKPYCDEGETTVGVRIDVVHRAPCTTGAKVIAEAVFESMQGRFYVYRVEARLENGHKLGWGHVHRAVVNVSKFMQKT
jgi:fluoroacetyl-CoA thioesterase